MLDVSCREGGGKINHKQFLVWPQKMCLECCFVFQLRKSTVTFRYRWVLQVLQITREKYPKESWHIPCHPS